MKLCALLVCTLVLETMSIGDSLIAAEPHAALRDAAECVPRGGLPNVLAKLKRGDDVRIGYLGGSITAAPGWRVKSLKWLQEQYPTAKLSEIHAAIGGTGSDLGVFRLQRDVLQFQPDLLFVEFAVNDGGADPAQIQRCMEGIVRQTFRANPATDICFVYTISQPFLADLKTGKCSRAATAMEGVADHYQIPSIHLGFEVAKLEAAGKVIFKGPKPTEPAKEGEPIVFSDDAVHPLDAGHELYRQAIARSWPQLIAATVTAKPHELIAPLRPDNWEQAKLVPITREMLKGDWVEMNLAKDAPARNFANRVSSMWKANSPEATLEFQVEGTQVAIYDLLGPDGGLLEVQIDDQPARKLARIDGYCTYHRLATSKLFADAAPGKHSIRVKLLEESPEKAKILFEQNRPDLEKNPAKYAGNHWYVGGILILGDVR